MLATSIDQVVLDGGQDGFDQHYTPLGILASGIVLNPHLQLSA